MSWVGFSCLQAGASNSTEACNMNELRQWNEQYGAYFPVFLPWSEQSRSQKCFMPDAEYCLTVVLHIVQVKAAAAALWS